MTKHVIEVTRKHNQVVRKKDLANVMEALSGIIEGRLVGELAGKLPYKDEEGNVLYEKITLEAELSGHYEENSLRGRIFRAGYQVTTPNRQVKQGARV